MVNHLTDDQIHKLLRGGHDPKKVYAAYNAAVEHKGAPTVILAKTVKGYGLGEAGEGRNITHQQKKLNERELREFRSRFDIPLPDEEVVETPFYRPPLDSPETQYLLERRKQLGGFIPERKVRAKPLKVPAAAEYAESLKGSGEQSLSTTGAAVRLLSRLLRHEEIGKHIVPIIPDEARTFGMDSLFRQVGIYSPKGQLYEPVDRETLLYYHEAKDGQILEEGITEAGAMSSFIAAGTAYANLGLNLIPFYFYYSMFGFQRIGDLIWAAADSKAKGFLLGATAGRTTLNGEGLQHQDGHSHLLASTVPTLLTYDAAYAYEIAVIIKDGLRRLYAEGEEYFYYLTLYNENYPMPEMPQGVEEGILKGLYKLKAADKGPKVQSAYFWQRSVIARSFARAADSRRTVRRRGGCLERDQLQAAPRRGAPNQTMEHAPSDRAAEEILSRVSAARRRRSVYRGFRLHENGSRSDCALGPRRSHEPRHGRLRSQRYPTQPSAILRSRRRNHRARDALCALSKGLFAGANRRRSHQKARHRSGKSISPLPLNRA